MNDRGMSHKETAEYIGVSISELYNMRSRGEGPAYFKLKAKVIYRLKDINEWIEKRLVLPKRDQSA